VKEKYKNYISVMLERRRFKKASVGYKEYLSLEGLWQQEN